MPRMIPDAKLLLDEAGDAAPRPEGTAKAERFRPLGQQVRKLGTLRWAQLGVGPGAGWSRSAATPSSMARLSH